MKVLAKFYWDCGRSGDIDGIFIADKEDVQSAYGKHIYLGEVLGKHSEVCGDIDQGDIEIVSEDQIVIEMLLNIFPDGCISGFNPLDYIEETNEEDEDD